MEHMRLFRMSLVLLALYAASFAMAAEPQLLATLVSKHNYVSTLAFSPDGKMLAVGYSDNTVELQNVSTGNVIGTLEGHTGYGVRCVSFSMDGKQLASASLDQSIIWDVATRKVIRNLDNAKGIRNAVFSPDGKTLTTVSFGGIISFNIEKGERSSALTEECMLDIAASPDGKTLASACYGYVVGFWDLQTEKGTPTIIKNYAGEYVIDVRIWYSPDGKTLICGGECDKMRLWDVATGKRILECETTKTGIDVIAAAMNAPETNTLSAANSDGEIVTYDLATGKILATCKEKDKKRYTAAAYSSDGKLLAVGTQSDDSTFAIKIFKVSN